MYIDDALKDTLRDMLQESDYYFVLSELDEAYDRCYYEGYHEGYDDCRNKLL